MSAVIDNLPYINSMDENEAKASFFRCSGSSIWTDEMLANRPFASQADLHHASEMSWNQLTSHDWLNAFKIHPRIGDIEGLRQKFASTANWASAEQAGTAQASDDILRELAKGNTEYEQKFGFIFIVFATGKTAPEMLAILKERLNNDAAQEFEIACGEQKKITNIRLEKLAP